MPTFSFKGSSPSASRSTMETSHPPSKRTIISQNPPQLGPEHARPLRKTSDRHLQAHPGGVQTSKALPSVPSDQTTTTTRTLRPSASSSSFRHPSPSVTTPTSPSPSSSDYSQRSASPSNNSNSSSHADADTTNTPATTITTITTTTTDSDSSDASAPVVPPLTRVHFFCYHFHRTFAPSRNTHNPVPCMTCLKSNDEDNDKDSRRWRCTFCCLRICTDCMRGIGKCKDRSLMVFMEELVTALEQEGKQMQMQAEQESGGGGASDGNSDTCSK